MSALSSSVDDAPPFDSIPGFELRSRIGGGGYGTVYKACQTKLDRIVAVKLLRPDVTLTPVLAARFEAEAVILARLRHPNIVQVIDAGSHENRRFIVMELLEGEDLGRLLSREGPLEERLAWAIARQAVAALAHAADQGIVHRDIKPANIFLIPPPTGMNLPSGAPMVKVMDFGLALTHWATDLTEDRITPSGTVVGTPIYMAPEQHRAFTGIDHRIDIYALGGTVCHALTGRVPFRAPTFAELIEQKQAWSPGGTPRISPASAELLARMMAPDPSDRIGDYEELIAEIDKLLDQLSLTIETESSAVKPARRVSRWWLRGAAALAILLALGGVIVGGVKLWPKRKPAAEPAPVAYERRGDDVALFDKQSVSDWLPPLSGGVWNLASDADHGRVLAGIGLTRRLLPAADDYRLAIGLDLHTAAVAEVHFALPAESPDRGKRLVLRVSRREAVVGSRDGDKGTFERFGEPVPFPPPAWFEGRSSYLEVKIQHTGSQWMVWFNGSPMGRFSDRAQASAPELRLFADGGRARVDSVIFVPLKPK